MKKLISLFSIALLASFTASSVVLTGCGGNKSGAASDSTANASNVTNVTGAGGTFIYPLASKWFNEYQKTHQNLQINYQSIGSGGGIKQATEGTVDFGESDGPMNDQQIADFKAKRNCDVLHFPAAMGGVVPT